MTQIGTVYGQALYTLAQEEKLEESILQELTVLQECFQAEPGYMDLLSCVAVPKPERCQLLDESMGLQLHPYLLNFMKILVEKGKIRQFPDCCTAYRQCYYRDNGILPVTAVTALPLSQSQSQRLNEKLTSITGKTILLTNKVDASLMGGMRLDYDGKQLEDTIAHRLDSVRQLLKNTIL